jgi:hypothetical protein
MIIYSKFSNKNYLNKNLCVDPLLDICLFIIDFFHIFSFKKKICVFMLVLIIDFNHIFKCKKT